MWLRISVLAILPIVFCRYESSKSPSRVSLLQGCLIKQQVNSFNKDTKRIVPVDFNQPVSFDGQTYFWKRINEKQCEKYIGGDFELVIFDSDHKPQNIYWSCFGDLVCSSDLSCVPTVKDVFLAIGIFAIGCIIIALIMVMVIFLLYFCSRYLSRRIRKWFRLKAVQLRVRLSGQRIKFRLLDRDLVLATLNKMTLPAMERFSCCSKASFSTARTMPIFIQNHFWAGISIHPGNIKISQVGDTTSLAIINGGIHRIAFLIKTTATSDGNNFIPGYIVRPNTGFLEPQDTVMLVVEKTRCFKRDKKIRILLCCPISSYSQDTATCIHNNWSAPYIDVYIK